MTSGKDYLEYMLNIFLDYGRTNHVPMYMGEFSTTNAMSVDYDATLNKLVKDEYHNGGQWTEDMLDLLNKYKAHYSYHDYHNQNFGFYLSDQYQSCDYVNPVLYDVFQRKIEKDNVVTKPVPVLTAGDGKIDATWKAVDGATKYRVFTYLGDKFTMVGDVTSTSRTITGLKNGTQYGVLVIANVNGAWTDWSVSDVKYETPAQATKPIPTLVAGDGKITASWDAVSGATKYRLFTCLDGKFTMIGDMISNQKTITGLKNGTEYGVLVVANVNGAWTGWTMSDVRYATPLPVTKPVPTLIEGNGQITAQWDSVNGATKYRVFTYINEKFTMVGDVVSTSKTITGLTNGTEYGVLVIANVNGTWTNWSVSDVKYAIPSRIKKPMPVLTEENGQINVEWKAVDGATKYRVFKYSDGKFVMIGDVTSTSQTITGLSNGTEYGVLVIANVNGTWTEWTMSDVKYATPSPITKPVVKLTGGSGQITARWSKVNGATKYRVFKYSDGKFTMIADVTSTSYTITGLSTGTEYGVLVVANVSGAWTNWSMSDVKFFDL